MLSLLARSTETLDPGYLKDAMTPLLEDRDGKPRESVKQGSYHLHDDGKHLGEDLLSQDTASKEVPSVKALLLCTLTLLVSISWVSVQLLPPGDAPQNCV